MILGDKNSLYKGFINPYGDFLGALQADFVAASLLKLSTPKIT